jgi:two-component system response regulator NreC
MSQSSRSHRNSGADSYTNLTQREKEVLAMIAQGQTNKAIGSALNISANTVRAHVRCLMQKLSLDNRTQLAVHGLKEGLCTSPRSCAPNAETLVVSK